MDGISSIQSLTRGTGLAPRGPIGGRSTETEAPASDRFTPSLEDDNMGAHRPLPLLSTNEGQGASSQGGGTSSSQGGASQQSRADREADAALLKQCGEGCGCGNCSTVPGDADPLKTLRERDAEVKTHEAEHLRGAGEFAAGGPTYDMVTTRSGQSFAVGGKVHVDIAEIPNDPKRTVDKMKKLRMAALAPLKPSEQDQRVAAEAGSKLAAAEAKLAQKGAAA